MTDEELIKKLRDVHVGNTIRLTAADRINQLLEGNKGLADAFATVAVKHEMTEAKLAKAVETLKLASRICFEARRSSFAISIDALLTELENVK